MTAKIVLFPSVARNSHQALDSSEAFGVTWDAYGRTTKIDPEFFRLTGIALEDCHNGNWIERVHPDDVEAYVRKRHRAIGAGRPFKGSMRFMTDVGVYVRLNVQMVPVVDEGGHITRWTGALAFKAEDFQALVKAAQAACLFAWGLRELITAAF